jgi:hypothetical protein
LKAGLARRRAECGACQDVIGLQGGTFIEGRSSSRAARMRRQAGKKAKRRGSRRKKAGNAGVLCAPARGGRPSRAGGARGANPHARRQRMPQPLDYAILRESQNNREGTK